MSFYTCHAVWYCNGGKAAAILKYCVTYTRHTVGNRDRGKVAAATEYVKC